MTKSLIILLATLLSANAQASHSSKPKAMSDVQLCSEARTQFLANTKGNVTDVALKAESALFTEVRSRNLFSVCESTWYSAKAKQDFEFCSEEAEEIKGEAELKNTRKYIQECMSDQKAGV